MILKQYFLGCLSHASYLVADETTKVAAIVDPQRDVDQYLDDAKKLGLTIRHVVLTHFHADFVAGHLELREKTGAEIVLGAKAKPDYPVKKLADGEALVLGPAVKLVALETPGHTPESVCWLVFDAAKNASEPHAVLTGDTLFLGDVGRPDLLVAKGASSETMARDLYRSLRTKLLPLPDATIVYPAHGAGSACGKNMSTDTSGPLGVQKRANWALQEQSEDDFVRALVSEQGTPPRYFAFDAELNQRARPTLDASLERGLVPLAVDAFLAKAKTAQVLDSRDADEFARGYLKGAINVGLGGKYASWVGQVLDPRRPIVLVAAPGRERESAVRLGRIGFDQVQGYLEGGMKALEAARPDLVRRFERVAAKALDEQLHAQRPPVVIDVRTDGEWRAGHIEGALHVPLPVLEERLAEIPRGRPIVVQCGSGYRSTIGLSLLERAGVEGLTDLAGGMGAWQKAKLKTVAP